MIKIIKPEECVASTGAQKSEGKAKACQKHVAHPGHSHDDDDDDDDDNEDNSDDGDYYNDNKGDKEHGNDDDHQREVDGYNHAGVGCPTVEQESVEQPLVSKNVGGGWSYCNIVTIFVIFVIWKTSNEIHTIMLIIIVQIPIAIAIIITITLIIIVGIRLFSVEPSLPLSASPSPSH